MQCINREALEAAGLDHYGRRVHNLKQATVVKVGQPMFACDDMHASFGDELPRVAQMVRDPFDMVVSGYLYHSQKSTPEQFVHSYVPRLVIMRYDVTPARRFPIGHFLLHT
jgi:hypothetical protein